MQDFTVPGLLDTYKPRRSSAAPVTHQKWTQLKPEERQRAINDYKDPKTRSESDLEKHPEIAAHEYEIRRINMDNQLDLSDLTEAYNETGDATLKGRLQSKIQEYKQVIGYNNGTILPKAAREMAEML